MTPAVVSDTASKTYGEVVADTYTDHKDQVLGLKQNDNNDIHQLCLRSIHCLIADLCQRYGGGHPGGTMGMAAIGTALWGYTMTYSPKHHQWINRDRFVLSNGHACLLQYVFLHLTGYQQMTMEQLQLYHSTSLEACTPGHPEIENEGVELTTGQLGQGITNAVGLAIASKQVGATYNKPGYEVVNNMVFCMIGDACLQEGVALEAISFAGHLALDNLVVTYDNNQITCDGSVDLTNTENVNDKMRACGWHVIDVYDASYDVDAITKALAQAKANKDKPTFINCRTVIGVGSAVAGQAVAHGAAIGAENVKKLKQSYGFDPEESFHIPDQVYNFYRAQASHGDRAVSQWHQLMASYRSEHPDLAHEFEQRAQGNLPVDWSNILETTDLGNDPISTRKAAGKAMEGFIKECNSFFVGTADLSPSVFMDWPGKTDFQNPKIQTACGINGNYAGRFFHYGIREHAMCAMANGLAAFSPNFIVPVTSSFFIFYIYAAAAVRMGSIMSLQVIHIATHDSIGLGEDGPTHQPVSLPALFRAMPNILYIRPADAEEVCGAWALALGAKNTPSVLSLSRQNLPRIEGSDRKSVVQGAYVLPNHNPASPSLALIGTGSELTFAVQLAGLLKSEGVDARVISMPCQRQFDQQSRQYKRQVLGDGQFPVISVEAYSSYGWARYADAAFSMRTWGHSAPSKDVYRHFGFDASSMKNKVMAYLKTIRQEGMPLRGDFVEL